MISSIETTPGDRVLLLSIPAPEAVAGLARRLTRGLVVGLGGAAEVAAARRAARDLANVMFVPATAAEIPWQDGFFSRAIEPGAAWPSPDEAREIARVLAEGGLLHLPAGGGEAGALAACGFEPAGRTAETVTLRRAR